MWDRTDKETRAVMNQKLSSIENQLSEISKIKEMMERFIRLGNWEC